MNDKISRFAVIVIAAAGLSVSTALAADVNIGVNVGPPAVVITPPSITFAAPPPLVIVPSAPTVQYVPTGAYNVFVFGGRYYSFHNGNWFLAGHYNGPWKHIKAEKVPAPVVGVPVAYYRVPPGHAKRHDEGGAAAVGYCPPGQAKKGRC